jgi:hypothetical protein
MRGALRVIGETHLLLNPHRLGKLASASVSEDFRGTVAEISFCNHWKRAILIETP